MRDVLAIAAAMLGVGASFGAIATASGLPPWAVVAMSTIVFAGGAQFMAVGLISAGNPLAAVFGGLLINARHLPFGLALDGALGDRMWHRLLGSHLMTDEAVAFALAQPAGRARRRAFWLAGAAVFLGWNAGSLLGMQLGSSVGEPETFGLDAAFPAGLLALVLPSLQDREARAAVLLGVVIAVLTTPLLPAGLPVLLALAGLAVLALPRRRGGRSAAVASSASPSPPSGGPAPPGEV